MGAWGLGLFESDHDLEIVFELDWETQLIFDDLALRMIQATTPSSNARKDNMDEDGLCDKIHHSLLAKDNTNRASTRYHLEHMKMIAIDDIDGENAAGPNDQEALIEKYIALTKAQEELRNPFGDAYKTVILGACFMNLGCTLPRSFLDLLREIYPNVGLMSGGVMQIKQALGPDGFKDGEPYEFDSVTMDLVQYSSSEDGPVRKPSKEQSAMAIKARIYPKSGLVSVTAPNDQATDEQIMALSKKDKQRLTTERLVLDAVGLRHVQQCTSCKSAHCKDGSMLKACAKCKLVKYCGKECQQKDWKEHSRACRYIALVMRDGDNNFFGLRRSTPDMKERYVDQAWERMKEVTASFPHD